MNGSAGSRESLLTADYNQQMIEQVERFPYVRDRALYFGSQHDLLPVQFGPGLPEISAWTREHFELVGYVTPFDPADFADRRALRVRLGYEPYQTTVLVTVGGTGVGEALLRKVIAAWPLVRRERPDIRGIVVAGPRIDPDTLPRSDGLEIRGYVHNLYEHLAACDLAVVQGGLSTTMELTLNRRPFVYVPIRDHCEQVYHVTHRLERYRAGTRLDFDTLDAASMADAILSNLGADTSGYLPYEPGGAQRAASRIADLL
jgi:predicted glycosyltransferase